MKTEGVPGKISDHFKGAGTFTRDTVEQRAKELARINGRERFTEDDWAQAKRELQGVDNFNETGEADSIVGRTSWDEDPGESGHQAPRVEPLDEQTLAEHLVEEGVFEAEHDQMVEGSKPRPDEET